MKYAFNNNGVLQDVIITRPSIVFPESYAAQFIEVSDDAETGWVWDENMGTFTAPRVDILFSKIQKNAEINETRLEANFSTFQHLDKTFACDQLSRSDIDGTNGFVSLYGSLPPGWPGGWKAVDNTYISITSVNDWKAFYSSMFAQGNTNFLHAQALKTKLEQATTLQEVQDIAWGMVL